MYATIATMRPKSDAHAYRKARATNNILELQAYCCDWFPEGDDCALHCSLLDELSNWLHKKAAQPTAHNRI
jgi:hypothetical protein